PRPAADTRGRSADRNAGSAHTTPDRGAVGRRALTGIVRARSCGTLTRQPRTVAQQVSSALVNGDGVDDNGLDRLVAPAGADGADGVDDVAAGLVGDLAKDRVPALQVWGRA